MGPSLVQRRCQLEPSPRSWPKYTLPYVTDDRGLHLTNAARKPGAHEYNRPAPQIITYSTLSNMIDTWTMCMIMAE